MEITALTPTQHGPAEWFTGDVWFDVLAAPPAPGRLRVNAVHFAPGAHTCWHRHATGQTLHVTEGLARVGTVPDRPSGRPRVNGIGTERLPTAS